jgi:hypothetical protein
LCCGRASAVWLSRGWRGRPCRLRCSLLRLGGGARADGAGGTVCFQGGGAGSRDLPGGLGCWLGQRAAVPQGSQAGVELAGVIDELSGTLVGADAVRGTGGDDQPPGGDVVAVLLPQRGAGRVERSRLLGQLPGPVQVPCLVRLAGGLRRAVRLHAGGVFRSCGGLPGILLALRGDVVRASGGRQVCCTCYRLGWLGFGLLRAAGAAGLLAGWRGMIWLLLRHAVECLADFPDPLAGGGEFFCVRELLADAGAGVGDLAAGVVDFGQRICLARF